MERTGPMPEPEVLAIFWQILSALRAVRGLEARTRALLVRR